LGGNGSTHNFNPAGQQVLKLTAALPAFLMLDRTQDLIQGIKAARHFPTRGLGQKLGQQKN
jgi:hypothetical protein